MECYLNRHSAYTAVTQVLTDFNRTNLNLSNADALDFIEGFAGYLKNLISSNSGKNLGEIAMLINFL